MIAGTMEFSLGLQSAQFLNGIRGGLRQLAGFTAAAVGVRSAFSALQGAVDKGGQLFDLSKRTGASVAALYQMQEALKQIGESADSAGSLITKMQRVAGNAEGQGKLAKLGLGADAGIEDVAAKIARLNPGAQTAAAFDLFGREGARSMLAIARSAEDFQSAMQAAAGDAAVWQRNAERFDELGDKLTALKSRVSTFFAEVAGGIFDLVDVAKNATNEGRFYEVLAAGAQGWFTFVTEGWSEVLSYMTVSVLDWISGIGPKLEAMFTGLTASLPPFLRGGALAAGGILANVQSGANIAAVAAARLGEEAAGRRSHAFDAFNKLWEEFKTPSRPRPKGALAIGDDFAPVAEKDARTKPDVTALEKIGLIFNGGGANPALDAQRRTAKATERTAKGVEQLVQSRGGELVND